MVVVRDTFLRTDKMEVVGNIAALRLVPDAELSTYEEGPHERERSARSQQIFFRVNGLAI